MPPEARQWTLSRQENGFVLIGGPSLQPGDSVTVYELPPATVFERSESGGPGYAGGA